MLELPGIDIFYVGQLNSVCCLCHLKAHKSVGRFFWSVVFGFENEKHSSLPYTVCADVSALQQCFTDCAGKTLHSGLCTYMFPQPRTHMGK